VEVPFENPYCPSPVFLKCSNVQLVANNVQIFTTISILISIA